MRNLPRIGVSSCLLGHNVRFDGGHKQDRWIKDKLASHAVIQPVCPEAGIGLGIPRPAIRLQQISDEVRLVNSKNPDIDLTERMKNYCHETLEDYARFDGFILKKSSPTCGVFRVPVVVHAQGHRRHDGTGLFAYALMQRYPWLPIEEEGRLNDTRLRDNFLERVYALHRWHAIKEPDINLQGLIEFHAAYKFMLMARDQVAYRELGQWVANTTIETLPLRRQAYLENFMLAMKKSATPGQNINVLMHIMGYFKKFLSMDDKQELLNHFDSYKNNQLPLSAILLLLKHYLRKYPDTYLQGQSFLSPFPTEIIA